MQDYVQWGNNTKITPIQNKSRLNITIFMDWHLIGNHHTFIMAGVMGSKFHQKIFHAQVKQNSNSYSPQIWKEQNCALNKSAAKCKLSCFFAQKFLFGAKRRDILTKNKMKSDLRLPLEADTKFLLDVSIGKVLKVSWKLTAFDISQNTLVDTNIELVFSPATTTCQTSSKITT